MSAARRGTLLVDTSFLGDLLCAEPMVRRAAELWPEEPVDFLAGPAGGGILAGHPGIGQLWIFDKRGAQRGPGGLLSMARELRDRGYARAVCSHRSWRTALLLRLAGIPRRTAFHNAAGAWLYSEKVHYPQELHEVQRNLALVETAAAREAGEADPAAPPAWQAPRMFPSEEERASAAALLPDAPFVAVAPGSLWMTKRWPAESFAALAAEFAASGQALVLVGGPDDRELCAGIAAAAEQAGPGLCTDLAGRTSLRESYAVLERADCLLTNDSAPMHLGVAAGIPVVATYCSTVPAFGFAPRGPRDVVLEVEGLDCRPCGMHGHPECPEGHFRCGRDMSVATVSSAVRERLAAPV